MIRLNLVAGLWLAALVAPMSHRATADVHFIFTNSDAEPDEAPTHWWVYFTDKGFRSAESRDAAIAQLTETCDRHALARRMARRTAPGLFDARDLPVNADYVDAIRATGARRRVTSRWLNAISVWATPAQREQIAALPFVRAIEPVRRGRRIEPVDVRPAAATDDEESGGGFRSEDYGQSKPQIEQLDLIAVHDAGYTGKDIRIGVLDTGFDRTHSAFNDPDHPLQVIAERDFLNDDDNTAPEEGDPYGQHFHGTWILGVIGAYKPGELIGAAFDASFILCKTEDVYGEYQAEEDYYVAGLEFAEEHGADVCTSSLGYIDWYQQSDLDGRTAVTTKGVNIATENGVVCCTAMGNASHDDDPSTSHFIAPADAFRVLSCGAVYDEGNIAGFSSDGPTADGRLKPEVLARGVDTVSVSVSDPNAYDWVSGTSLSTPLVASVAACLVQARPEWTVDALRGRLFYSASDFVQNRQADPSFIRGYGILDAYAALTFVDCDGDGVDDLSDIESGTYSDVNGNSVPDGCEHVGDVNCDDGVDFDDIDGFVLAITNRDEYEQAFPGCDFNRADIDGDFDVNFNDIDPFVELLIR